MSMIKFTKKGKSNSSRTRIWIHHPPGPSTPQMGKGNVNHVLCTLEEQSGNQWAALKNVGNEDHTDRNHIKWPGSSVTEFQRFLLSFQEGFTIDALCG